MKVLKVKMVIVNATMTVLIFPKFGRPMQFGPLKSENERRKMCNFHTVHGETWRKVGRDCKCRL